MAEVEQAWNRACATEPGTGPGDRHLHALLDVHGMLMNGGVDHAVEVKTAEQFARAADACDYLGLPEVTALLRRMPGSELTDEAEAELSSAYWSQAEDSLLYAAFKRRWEQAPGDFAPLDPDTTSGAAI
jgi:hypothetical protein